MNAPDPNCAPGARLSAPLGAGLEAVRGSRTRPRTPSTGGSSPERSGPGRTAPPQPVPVVAPVRPPAAPAALPTPLALRGVDRDVANRRLLGAYYTPHDVARTLVRWALNGQPGPILDPSYGGCAFLHAASRELRRLGDPNPEDRIYGVDVDPKCVAFAQRDGVLAASHCVTADFLALAPADLPSASFRAIVGNPPYVRHHWLKGASRASALAAADAHPEVVRLAGTASLWAYFVVHSLRFLARGARLALLVPDALLQAGYATEVRTLLAASFRRVTLLHIHERLFSDTDESVVLIAADDFGQAGALAVRTVASASELAAALADDGSAEASSATLNGRTLTAAAAERLDALVASPAFAPLSQRLICHIGVVTGANDHFVLRGTERASAGLPVEATVPIVSRTAWLRGLTFTADDHEAAAAAEGRAYLVCPTAEQDEIPAVRDWIARGAAAGLEGRHKCAERKPWHRIARTKAPDAFITAMRSGTPRLVLNVAASQCTNTIYAVDARDLDKAHLEALAVAFLTTPVALWAELHGRRYSRGALKLDVGTLNALPLPLVPAAAGALGTVDAFLRAGREDEARRAADRAVLVEGLGIAAEDLSVLEDALEVLRTQRLAIAGRGGA